MPIRTKANNGGRSQRPASSFIPKSQHKLNLIKINLCNTNNIKNSNKGKNNNNGASLGDMHYICLSGACGTRGS